MSRYINPARVIWRYGTPLDADDYASARAQTGSDLLVLLLDTGAFRTAAVIPDQAEWECFYGAYAEGHWLSCDAYRINPALLQAAGGRIG
jgi:hypothetical protein